MKKIVFTAIAVLLLTACTQKTSMNPNAADDAMAKKPEVTQSAKPSHSPEDEAMSNESSNGAMMKDGSYQFKLSSLNNSGRQGWAYIKEDAGKVKVTLNMLESKSSTATAEPAHIHIGKCPEPGAVKYALTNVVGGKSETTLPAGVTLASLMTLAEGTDGLAINVHASAADLKTYVACGDLTFKKGTTMKNDAMDNGSGKPSSSPRASQSPKASNTAKPSHSPDPNEQ